MPLQAHHRFVKTTPKPRATKKRSGELGPFPPLLPGLPVGEAVGEDPTDDVEVAILAESLHGHSARNQELLEDGWIGADGSIKSRSGSSGLLISIQQRHVPRT